MSDNTIPETPVLPEIPETPEMDFIPPMDTNPKPKDGDTSKDWMAIVSLVAGILSLCGALFAPLGCVVALASVVFGFLGLKSSKRTLAIIGLVIGALGILLSLIFGIIELSTLFFLDGGNY